MYRAAIANTFKLRIDDRKTLEYNTLEYTIKQTILEFAWLPPIVSLITENTNIAINTSYITPKMKAEPKTTM